MVDVENNNAYTRNFFQWDALLNKGRVDPELFNNAQASDGYPGLQKALRDIIAGIDGPRVLYTGTHDCAPTGTLSSFSVDSGTIITKNNDGETRIVSVAAAGPGLLINSSDLVCVASNDGTVSTKNKASVLATDVVIAFADGGLSVLFDARNFFNGVQSLSRDFDTLNLASDLDTYGANYFHGYVTAYKDLTIMGSLLVAPDFVILGADISLSAALALIPDGGTIFLPPATYTGSVTITKNVTIMGTDRMNTIISGTITISGDFAFTLAGVTLNGRVYAASVQTKKQVYRDCTITSSSGTYAAVEYANGTTMYTYAVEMVDCDITGGAYGSISAVEINGFATLCMKRCSVTGNSHTAYAVWVYYTSTGDHANMSFEDCIFDSNSGGLYLEGGNVIVRGCRFVSAGESCIGLNFTVYPKSVLVSDCSFIGKFGNAVEAIGDTYTHGIVTGCYFYITNTSLACGYAVAAHIVSNNTIIQVTSTKLTYGIDNYGLAVGNIITAATAIHAEAGAKKHANFENGTYVHGDTT